MFDAIVVRIGTSPFACVASMSQVLHDDRPTRNLVAEHVLHDPRYRYLRVERFADERGLANTIDLELHARPGTGGRVEVRLRPVGRLTKKDNHRTAECEQ